MDDFTSSNGGRSPKCARCGDGRSNNFISFPQAETFCNPCFQDIQREERLERQHELQIELLERILQAIEGEE